jgi:hypothetical protein
MALGNTFRLPQFFNLHRRTWVVLSGKNRGIRSVFYLNRGQVGRL